MQTEIDSVFLTEKLSTMAFTLHRGPRVAIFVNIRPALRLCCYDNCQGETV